MESVRCAKCGAERSSDGPCPKCLFGLGLESSGPAYEQIGPYRIVSRLGRGGMGEVYRARDDRLGREVAIKVLPASLEDDPNRIARFRREARVAASLNHPNIAAIYGFEEIDETHYLVMELVEGRTLADRLKSGPLPIDETVSVVAQIAEGLEAAHEIGVVHRDLKPGNVMLLPDGKVKILDFGLAKALDPETSAADLYLSTISAQHTTPGTVMGTAPYMSPEQARGRPVDRRTDIWSLGCVLYECLAGRRAFEGETATDVLAKVLERDPEWDALPLRTPARLRELVERCLEKDPRRRIRDSGDVRIELERAREAREWTSSGVMTAARSGPRNLRGLLPWGVAGLALAVAVAAIVVATATARWSRDSHDGRPRTAATLPLKVDVTDPDIPGYPASDHSSVAVSADGMTIAYFGRKPQGHGFEWSICLRRADEIRVLRCVASPDPLFAIYDPFFSPDGKWLGFSSRGLYKIPLIGGGPTLVAESSSPGGTKGAVWTERGIVFSPAAKAGLFLVGENGGAVEPLTEPDASKGEVSHRWPAALPDGRHLLFTIKKEGITSFDQAEIALLDLETRSWTTLIRGGTFPRYLPNGYIVYARDGAILAVPFDRRAGTVRGTPVTVLAGVMTEPGSGAAQFAVAPDAGALVFVPGGPNIQRWEFVWLDRQGTITPVGAPLAPYYRPCLSPDGTRVASTVFGATDTVVVYDFARGSSVRAATRGNSAVRAWYPDGRRLLFSSDAEGGPSTRLYETSADGTGTPRPLGLDVDGETAMMVGDATGSGVVYLSDNGLYFRRTEGDARPLRLTDPGEVAPVRPTFSPDGRWIAYDNDVSGRREVYVRPFPTGNGIWQVSRGGGYDARWSPRGDELVYQRDAAGERWLVAVRLTTTPTLIQAAAPRDIVKLPERFEWNGLTSDGRILCLRPVAPQFAGDRVAEILNWFEQVRQKLPSE